MKNKTFEKIIVNSFVKEILLITLLIFTASLNAVAETSPENSMQKQITELRDKVNKMEMLMQQHGKGMPANKNMPMKPAGGGMEMMGSMMSAMGPMMGSMMGNMGAGAGMGKAAMISALPGFPGASHIYHIGATNFFLDHPQHIVLTPEQQSAISKIRENTLIEQGEYQRKVQQAEQELSLLTSSDQPDFSKIEEKAKEIEKIKVDQRLGFIKAVGECAKILTDQQRKALLGQIPPMGMPSVPMANPGMGMGAAPMPQTMEDDTMPPMGGSNMPAPSAPGGMGDM